MDKLDKYINQDYLMPDGTLCFCLSVREITSDSEYGTELIFYESKANKIYTTRISYSRLIQQYKWLKTDKLRDKAYHKMVYVIFNEPESFDFSSIKGYIYASKLR